MDGENTLWCSIFLWHFVSYSFRIKQTWKNFREILQVVIAFLKHFYIAYVRISTTWAHRTWFFAAAEKIFKSWMLFLISYLVLVWLLGKLIVLKLKYIKLYGKVISIFMIFIYLQFDCFSKNDSPEWLTIAVKHRSIHIHFLDIFSEQTDSFHYHLIHFIILKTTRTLFETRNVPTTHIS